MRITARTLRTRAGLTGRGWLFLATGSVVTLAGALTGVMPVTQFGVLVAVVPMAARLLTHAPRSGFELQRVPSAREVPSGEVLTVTVTVRGRFPRGRSLLLEDLASPALGGTHRFALNGVSGRAREGCITSVRCGSMWWTGSAWCTG